MAKGFRLFRTSVRAYFAKLRAHGRNLFAASSGLQFLVAVTVEDFRSLSKIVRRVRERLMDKIIDFDDVITKRLFNHSEALAELRQESAIRKKKAITHLGYETEQKPAADLDVQLDCNTRVKILYDDLAHRANSWLLSKDQDDTETYPRMAKQTSHNVNDLLNGKYDYPAYESLDSLTDVELNDSLGRFGLDVVACQDLTEKEKLNLLRTEIGSYMC